MIRYTQAPDLSRRTFLTTVSTVLAGAALGGSHPSVQPPSGIPNGMVYCNLARGLTHPASTRTAIINCIPAIRQRLCTLA